MADNLLDKASILLTPTAYDNGSMLSIKPNENLYGSEEVTNGDFSNGLANWSTYGVTSVSSGVVTLGASANSGIFQGVLTQGKKYKATINVASYNSVGIAQVTNDNGLALHTITTTGLQTFYFEQSISNSNIIIRAIQNGVLSISSFSIVEDLSGDFQFSRNSAATRVNAQGLVENVQIISPELVSNGNFSQIGTEEVLNGNFSQEGSEQISNGSFDTDTKWTKGTGWSISGGSANCDGTQSGNTFIKQQGGILGANIDFVVGKTYKVNFDVVVTSGHIANIEVASGYDSNAIATSGNHTTYITAVSTNDRFTITANPDFNGSIDNVSVKEVGQNWTLGTGWSIGEDKVVGDGTSFTFLTQNLNLINKNLKLTFEIKDYQSGTFRLPPTDRGDGLDVRFSGNGTQTVYYQSTLNTFRFQQQAFNGSITNISVKEVAQDWSVIDSDADNYVEFNQSQGTARLKFLNTSPLTKLQSTAQYISGKKYKLIVDVAEVVSGGIKIDAGGVQQTYNTVGIQESIIEPTGNQFIAFYRATSNVDITLNSVSVKEITDDTNIPRINYEGFSYQDTLGNEEVVNGDFSNGSANWFNPDAAATFSNNSVTINGGSGNRRINQPNVTSPTTSQFKLQYEITEKVGTSDLKVYTTNSGSAAYTIVPSTIGVHTFYFSSNLTTFYFNFSSSSGSITIDNVSVKEVTGQEVVPDSGCGSWLLEKQSTNLVTESQALSTMQTQATITDNNLLSPTGDVNASLVVENTATNSHGIRKATIIPTNASAVDYTISVFAKKKERQFVQFQFYADSTQYNSSLFNLNNGTTTGDSSTHKIEDYGNGWYRCSFTDSITQSTGGYNFAAAYMSQSSTSYYAGDGTSGLYMFGFQLEQQSYATSYIPTNGAASTRLQDIANNSGNSSLINSTEGVLYAEVAALSDSGSARVISISDGNPNSNGITIYYFESSGYIFFQKYVNGVRTTNLNTTTITKTDFNKIAIRYNSTEVNVFINGANILNNADTNIIAPNTLQKIQFDRGDGASNFFGEAKALAVFPILTNAELQSLTTQ